VAGTRWAVEERFQTATKETGLGHHQVPAGSGLVCVWLPLFTATVWPQTGGLLGR
jgi:hypothetical protein